MGLRRSMAVTSSNLLALIWMRGAHPIKINPADKKELASRNLEEVEEKIPLITAQ
jgi:hypothetical protein